MKKQRIIILGTLMSVCTLRCGDFLGGYETTTLPGTFVVVISDYASLNKDSSTLIEESKVNVKAISFQTEDDGEQMVFIPDLEKPPSVYISLLDYCATTYNEFID